MLGLIGKIYKNGLELIAWAVLIGGFIGGGFLVAGYNEEYFMIGAIIGAIVAFIFNVFVLGQIAIFVNMSQDLEDIKSKLYEGGRNDSTLSKSALLKCPSCKVNIRQDDAFCQNCGMKLN